MASSAEAGMIDGGQPKRFLRPCLLLLLKESPAHGYDLLERLREFEFERDAGGVYRALRSMEHEGLVHSTWEASYLGPDRRRYELTPLGDHFLARWAGAVNETRRVLARYLHRYEAIQSLPQRSWKVCLGLPGRVVEILDERGGIAVVEMSGSRRRVSLALLTGSDRPLPGDFVLVHAGLAVSRVDEQEAHEITLMLRGYGEPLAEAEVARWE